MNFLNKVLTFLNNNLPTIVTCIVSLSTVISSVVIVRINNKHQLNLKRLEIYELAKKEALSNYINDTCLFFYSPTKVKLASNALASMQLLFVYFEIDDALKLKILEVYNTRENKLLNEVIETLSTQLQSTYQAK